MTCPMKMNARAKKIPFRTWKTMNIEEVEDSIYVCDMIVRHFGSRPASDMCCDRTGTAKQMIPRNTLHHIQRHSIDVYWRRRDKRKKKQALMGVPWRNITIYTTSLSPTRYERKRLVPPISLRNAIENEKYWCTASKFRHKRREHTHALKDLLLSYSGGVYRGLLWWPRRRCTNGDMTSHLWDSNVTVGAPWITVWRHLQDSQRGFEYL